MDNLKAKLEDIPYFNRVNRDANLLEFIVLIKGLVLEFKDENNISDALYIRSK